MKNLNRKRVAFRPSVAEASLEERLVLATVTLPSTANTVVTAVAPLVGLGGTPLPASPPFTPGVTAARGQDLTVAQLRTAFRQQVRAAMTDLRNTIQADLRQLQANGSVPTTQQQADFNARVAGALNATALRLSAQAALLPQASNRLLPAIQNTLLGTGANSLGRRLSALAQSDRLNGSAGTLASALSRQINLATQQNIGELNRFFNTTPVSRLSVDSSGQRIPLQQFLGGQLLNQVGNTFGSLAQSFPNVANSILFPNGATGTPSQDAMNAFTSQFNNALGTAAFQVGSALSLFPGSSNVVAQLQPMLFGSANSTNSLASALQNLPFGDSAFNTAVGSAFNTGFQNMLSPISSFFQLPGQSNPSLPTSGFTNLFGTPFLGNTFNNGFNNGFATDANTGFIGFGQAPTDFNTNFGSGFNNFVSTMNQNLGFNLLNSGSVGSGSLGGFPSGGGVTDGSTT